MTWLQGLTPIDYVIIGIVVGALLLGWVRGFVEVLSGFLVFLVATFIAGQYTDTVLAMLNRMWNLQERFAGVLERRINLPPEVYKVPAAAIPFEKAADWLRSLPLPAGYKETLAQRIVEWSQSAGSQNAADFILNQLAGGVLSAVVFVVLVSVASWLLALLVRLVSDQIKELPLVGPTNRLLGSLVMGFEAVVILALVVGMLGPTLSMYGYSKLGGALQYAQFSPQLLTVYHWLRQVAFGQGGGTFFLI
ncbi:MAG TPA: CvpA family protein [Symbiobacteriaceae bacterium]|jgi:uncharacterized membrane protein required for colicin V production|nr:CvpA family protein [Symbiobacteriaceae bacterium]